jgi:integral membrane sensor domain MASE1
LALLTTAYFALGKLGLADGVRQRQCERGLAAGGARARGDARPGDTGSGPAIAIGAFLVNLTTSYSVMSSAIIAGGNTLEALAAWWLVTNVASGIAVFERANTVFRFAVVAGRAAVLAATIGTMALTPPAGTSGPVWITWWLGDTVGIVLITPLW